jgi:hypothetical protein
MKIVQEQENKMAIYKVGIYYEVNTDEVRNNDDLIPSDTSDEDILDYAINRFVEEVDCMVKYDEVKGNVSYELLKTGE